MVWILRTKPRRLNCHNIIIINALARFSHSAFFPTRVEFLRLFQMQTRGRVGAAGYLPLTLLHRASKRQVERHFEACSLSNLKKKANLLYPGL